MKGPQMGLTKLTKCTLLPEQCFFLFTEVREHELSLSPSAMPILTIHNHNTITVKIKQQKMYTTK